MQAMIANMYGLRSFTSTRLDIKQDQQKMDSRQIGGAGGKNLKIPLIVLEKIEYCRSTAWNDLVLEYLFYIKSF